MQKVLTFNRNGINYHIFRFNGSSKSSSMLGAVREYQGIGYSVFRSSDSVFSTVKDVGVEDIIEYALSQGANVIVNLTSGNLGYSLKYAVMEHNKTTENEQRIKVVHIVSPQYRRSLEELAGGLLLPTSGPHGGTLWREFRPSLYSIPCVFPEYDERWLTSQEREAIAREIVKRSHSGFKVNGVVDVTHYIPNEYIRQAEEVLRYQHEDGSLDYLAIPVGTGKAFISFYKALNNIRRAADEIKIKLVGFVPAGENPIYHTFVRKKGKQRKVYVIENFDPKSRADKLSCPSTDLLPEIREAMHKGHRIIELEEKDISNANIEAYRIAKIRLEDSASVGFALVDLEKIITLGIKEGANVGIFITGMGLYHTPPSWMEEVTQKRK